MGRVFCPRDSELPGEEAATHDIHAAMDQDAPTITNDVNT